MKKIFNLNLVIILITIFGVLIAPTKVDAAVNWVWPTKDAWHLGEISDKGIYISSTGAGSLDIVAARSGTVVYAITEERARNGFGFNGYGNTVVIKHANKQYTLYGYLASFDVKVNDKVNAGDKIGTMGKSGASPIKSLIFEYMDGPIPSGVTFYDPIKDIYWNKYDDKIIYNTTMRISRNNSFYNELFSTYYNTNGNIYVRNDVPFSSAFTSKYTAMAFGEGNIYIICGIAGAFIIVCICAIIFIKNKKNESKDNKTKKEKK